MDPREVVVVAPASRSGFTAVGLRGSDLLLEVPATVKAVNARLRDALTVDVG